MRLLIDDSIELNQTDEKRFAAVLVDLQWLGKHAPDETATKAKEAAKLTAEVLGEIKKP